MSDAPEKIWRHESRSGRITHLNSDIRTDGVEYIRSDVVEEMLKEQRQMCADKVISEYNVAAYTKSITVQALRKILLKACLSAVGKEKNKSEPISSHGENGMQFTAHEYDILRQWFNALSDIAPKYLDEEDHELMMKINYYLNAVGGK